MLDINIIPILTDNYAYALVDKDSGTTAIVDPGDGGQVDLFLRDAGIKPDYILNTHHHPDHTGGNEYLRKKYDSRIIAPKGEGRIPHVDIAVKQGDHIEIGGTVADIIETPAHTKTHICFYLKEDKALFCGDTLFSVGCGRLFEGSAEDMFSSLKKIKELPDDTKLFCGHEYTLDNIRFAKTLSGDHSVLLAYERHVRDLRKAGRPSLPVILGLEKKINPFLTAQTVQEFAVRRQAKDRF